MERKQWKIKTKRDWVIAAGFLFLLSYLWASRYQGRINEQLMRFSPEKMSYFNQPERHGVYLLTILMAAVLFSILWAWQRKMAKKSIGKGIAVAWIAAIFMMGGIWLTYQAECRQIVNTPSAGLTPNVSVCGWGKSDLGAVELTEEEKERILKLCLGLKAPSKEEQENMRAQIDEDDQISIDIWYPEYKNHSYHLWFFLEEDVLYLNRGHSSSDGIFYDGTEMRELLEEIFAAHRIQE